MFKQVILTHKLGFKTYKHSQTRDSQSITIQFHAQEFF